MFSKQDKMKVPVGTCAMYPLVLNQWEGLISPEWILSLLWRRGLAPPGEDKVDPTTLHHLRSHFHILSHQLIASSFVVSHFFGIWKLFARCLFKLWRCVLFLFGAKAYASYAMLSDLISNLWWRKWIWWWPAAFKTLSSRFLSSLQEEKFFLSTFVSLFENSSSLVGSAFAGCVIVFLILPAGSFYQLQSREAEGAAIGRTWFQRWTFTGNHPIRDNTPERHARTRTSSLTPLFSFNFGFYRKF
jgi:hypothetical protein